MADDVTTPAVAGRRSDKPVRYYHHGRSPAAWTGVAISGIGFVAASIGAVLGPNWVLCYVGAGLVLLGLVAGGILKAAGYGNG
ncbi:HGxxPAAW family protein [Aestuariimicrobium soli]|uniref:HGxxPAAW family protein n=1 Tax=Aestuariimicrobium soli TaxID=2035834 RepID=UPI003EB87F71